MRKPDVSVTDHGTIYLLHLRTQRATAWVDDHVVGDCQFLGNVLAVEHRFVADVIVGMNGDGLVVAVAF